jgi:hypothetical protein
MYRKFGGSLVCIDGTHNVTMYENTQLTTLVVRDNYAHGKPRLVPHCSSYILTEKTGIPIAWMLASNGRQETIQYFLRLNHERSPDVLPRYFMSDFDKAQINACRTASTECAAQLRASYVSFILLCWWHVLHAWQQNIRTSQHPELWELLKKWLRMVDEAEFEATWLKIQEIAPPKFIEYLEDYWMSPDVKFMWSGVFCKGRNIFDACDTNMLVEAYVAVFSCLSHPLNPVKLASRSQMEVLAWKTQSAT